MKEIEENTLRNKAVYDKIYSNIDVKSILEKINNVDVFLSDATKTDTSWFGLYHGNFKAQLKGKKILELGCGDCTNLAVMAALGAEVYGNDISQEVGVIIEKLNKNYQFDFPITFIEGDFLNSSLDNNQFDIVVGKSFVHHLTNDQEIEFTKMIT